MMEKRGFDASNIPRELAQKWEQLTTRHDYGKKQIDSSGEFEISLC
jgi:hypothetical protein